MKMETEYCCRIWFKLAIASFICLIFFVETLLRSISSDTKMLEIMNFLKDFFDGQNMRDIIDSISFLIIFFLCYLIWWQSHPFRVQIISWTLIINSTLSLPNTSYRKLYILSKTDTLINYIENRYCVWKIQHINSQKYFISILNSMLLKVKRTWFGKLWKRPSGNAIRVSLTTRVVFPPPFSVNIFFFLIGRSFIVVIFTKYNAIFHCTLLPIAIGARITFLLGGKLL